MTMPKPSDDGATFDLVNIGRELQASEAYLREGQTARTLTRSSDLRIVLVALGAGNVIPEHHADVTTTVQTMSGHIRLQLPDRSVELAAGCLLVLGTGLRHDVQADVDSTFLLTLGWSTSKPDR